MIRLIVLLFSLSLTQALTAQDLFTVRVGMFRDVKISEFTELRPMGFVYGIPGEGNITEVFVGHFNEQNKAVGTASALQQKGYRNAQAFALPVGQAAPLTYVQVSLHSGTRPIEWPALERTGQLYVETVDGVSKILTGPFPGAAAASAALPSIKALGYRDAFPKQIDPARLIRIGTFETGIKKPLIPIDLQNNAPPTAAPVPQQSSTVLSPTPSPATYGSGTAPATAPTTQPNVSPAPAATPGLNVVTGPAIDGKTKRSSAAELQTVLKEKGYYDGAIDGFYGPGTTGAFNSAWNEIPEIQKYKLLAQMVPNDNIGANWEETKVLLAIVNDMAAGMTNDNRQTQMMAQRPTLFNGNAPLSAAASTRTLNWAATVWANLDDWAIDDPLHAKIFSAFRLAYHQTQVRLEDHYMDLGLSPLDARDMATAMLQNLTGAQLDRFL